jgi:hypothetical protein
MSCSVTPVARIARTATGYVRRRVATLLVLQTKKGILGGRSDRNE